MVYNRKIGKKVLATEMSIDDGMFLIDDDLGSPLKKEFLKKLNEPLPWQEMEGIIEPIIGIRVIVDSNLIPRISC